MLGVRILVAISLLCLILAGATSSARAAPPAQTTWQLYYADEFNSGGDLAGWSIDRGGGNDWIDTANGFLHLESPWSDTYPMIWRNDLYSYINANNLNYAVEIRFRRPYLTAYGSAFGVGTTSFSGSRYAVTDSYPVNNYENILHNEQHQPSAPGRFGGNANVYQGGAGKVSIPVDYTWHTMRAEFIGGTGYLYLDGASYAGSNPWRAWRPLSTYFGNSYDESWGGAGPGSWSTLDIDYIRIYIGVVAPTPTWTFTATATSTFTATPTATATPTVMPTATFTPTPTWTPTLTNTPTPTSTPSPRLTPTPQLALTLNRDYAFLLQCGAIVGEPTQVLRGVLSGGFVSGQEIRLVLIDPNGNPTTYYATTDAVGQFVLDAVSAGGDTCFGSSLTGNWSAQAYYDLTGLASNPVRWSVAWYIIHTTR